mmetsp:Transcript_89559/g.253840  ORF Transcript_89559/g.253840 Transcript_89559/m.253840 type:complete len:232 (-) Transcript_89559:1505-2200(-)
MPRLRMERHLPTRCRVFHEDRGCRPLGGLVQPQTHVRCRDPDVDQAPAVGEAAEGQRLGIGRDPRVAQGEGLVREPEAAVAGPERLEEAAGPGDEVRAAAAVGVLRPYVEGPEDVVRGRLVEVPRGGVGLVERQPGDHVGPPVHRVGLGPVAAVRVEVEVVAPQPLGHGLAERVLQHDGPEPVAAPGVRRELGVAPPLGVHRDREAVRDAGPPAAQALVPPDEAGSLRGVP